MQRVTRTILSFFIALLLYWSYAQAIVPLIEPEVRPGPGPTNEGNVAVTGRRSLEGLFPGDAWELDEPKLLETSHGLLLFRDYLQRDNGTLELRPVTMIYYSSDRGSDDQPILIQAPQGAILQFDRRINLALGDFGKPVDARLLGQIVIRRPRSSPDSDDEIYITTRNVKIDRQRIWTPNDVEFRFGPHWGRGRDLQILLQSRKPGDAVAAANDVGVRMLELMHIEKILIAPNDRSLRKSIAPPQSVYAVHTQDAAETVVPIEVRCAGPFRFDFQQTVASLSEQVRMTRRYPNGVVDAMHCERLDMYFRKGPASAATTAAIVPASSVPQPERLSALNIDRFVAEGSPVTFEAPSENAYARASSIECFYAERRIILEDTQNAWLRHGQSEMEAPRLDYTAHPADLHRLGTLEAAGPGIIRGVTADAEPRQFTATWNEVLRLQPHADRHVLSLQGGARVEFAGTGTFSGEEMHLYLRESAPADGRPATESADRLAPDRLIVLRDIQITSPQLQGRAVRELRVWFVPPAAVPPNAEHAIGSPRAPSSAGPATPNLLDPIGPAFTQGGSRAGGIAAGDPRTGKGPPLVFDGDVIEARVIAGESMQLNDLTVAGKVNIRREPDATGARSVRIGGDLLEISDIGTGKARVVVRGTPAEAGAEGLLLRGAEILCQQHSNMMWIPGAGEMLTPERPPGSAGGPPTPPMKVTWGGSMQFDGRTVAFREGVEARGDKPSANGDVARFLIRGADLYIDLNRRVDFVQPGDLDHEPIDLLALRFPGQVWLENRTYGPSGDWKSWEEMQVTNLRLDQLTGKLDAQGPGWLSSVRLNSGSSPAVPVPGVPQNSGKLIHIQVHFQRAVLGNLQQRDLEFFERVRTTYGPVQDWQQRIDSERGELGAGGIELTSDRLRLSEIPSADDPRTSHHEMRAVGNVQVRGERFRAHGHELSYDDGKDLLILKSDGLGYASVTEEGGPGATEARTFHIYPKSRLIKTMGLRSVEFGPIGK